MKKIKLLSKFVILLGLMMCLSGCSTLTYNGEDYNENNIQTVKTAEEFMFDTYKKSNSAINCKIGISKTQIPEILALYVQIENLSYDTPYVFKVDDLTITTQDTPARWISTANYLNIYQTSEASSMAAMSSLSSTITNMTGMMANYNEFNQQNLQNSAQQSNNDAFSKMEAIGNALTKHTVRYSSTISPRKSQYFYFFFEDVEKYPIIVDYKGLNYKFRT